VLRELEKVKRRYLAPEIDLEIYFDDIVDAHERIWDMLENYKEVVEALEETNESVIAHRFNDILRVLTIFSIVFLPATLVASVWGMNVGLPGAGDPPTASHTTFWILIVAMIGLIGGMLAWFRRRGWF
jgi:magnesium transporter